MVTYLIIIAVVAVIMVAVGFALGNKSKGNGQNNAELIDNLHAQLTDLTRKIQAQESTIANQQNQIITLTSERDVQKTHAENFCAQLTLQKTDFEKQMSAIKENTQQTINTNKN